jgi:hypothetical protein
MTSCLEITELTSRNVSRKKAKQYFTSALVLASVGVPDQDPNPLVRGLDPYKNVTDPQHWFQRVS